MNFDDLKDDESANYAEGGSVPATMSFDELPNDSTPPTEVGVNAPPQVNANVIPERAIAAQAPPPFDSLVDDEDKYSTPTEIAKTAIEGAGKGFLGPIFTGGESALLGNEKEQLARQEANPGTAIAGEITGLGVGALTGTGLGGALGKVGSAVGVGGEALGLGKLGSNVVKSAIENLVYQGQSEVSKMILKDPAQTSDTAIADMGLAALVGGAFGTVPSLWKIASGTKTAQLLGSMANKLGGIEGVLPEAVENTIQKTGMEIAPEIRAGLSSDPHIQQMFKTLEQSDTASGHNVQQNYNEFRKQAGDTIINALGKTVDEVPSELSKYHIGKEIGSTLAKEYEAQVSPLSQAFDGLKSKFKNVELIPELKLESGDVIPSTVDSIADKISKAAIEEGWATSPSSDMMKLVNTTLKELPLQKNLKNLTDFISQVGANANKDPMNGPLRRAGGIIGKILKEAEADVIGAKLGETEGPLAVEAFKTARQQYAVQAALKDALDSRIHAGGSTSGFAKALKEMANTDGETLLRRLSGVGDANLLTFLQENYPQTAQLVKNYHINDLLKAASDKARPGFNINSEALLSKFNKLSPELKAFIASPEAQGKIGAVETIISEFNKLPHNYSNTARTLDRLMSNVPGSAVGMATYMHSHNPLSAGIMGLFTKVLGRDVPDAVRLSLLKFLGSNQKIDSAGFKTMVEFVNHTIKGENLISKATKNVFRAGTEVLPEHLIPKDKDRARLTKALDSIKQNPDNILNVAGKTGHYMPDHAAALGKTAATAIQTLDHLKPSTTPQAPLDKPRIANPSEVSRYNRALDIAEQPLMILKHMAEGRLTPEDVNLQKTLYPSLYAKLSEQLMNNAVGIISKGGTIPYQTKLGLSLYTGQALDSTMTPNAIIAAQPKPPQVPHQQGAVKPTKSSTSAIGKLPNMYRTPAQSAESDRMKRGQ